MGEPMCANLLARTDQPVVVHDVRPDPVERLVAAGAVDGGSIPGVVAAADVVLLSLPGGSQLQDVVAGPAGVLEALADRGQHNGADPVLIVDHTTAPVALTRELAARCADVGASYIDAPIARTRQAAADGTLSIMVGADEPDFDRALPILSLMGSDVTRCGGVGAGQVTKLLNNMMLFQNVRALAEAHAIADGLAADDGFELDVETVFDVIVEASGGSFALANHGRKAVLPDTYPENAFSVDYALKDLGYALDLADQLGIDAVGARTVGQLMESARAAGHRDAYFPVIRRML